MLQLLTQERELRFARSAVMAAIDRTRLAREARRAVARIASPEPCAQTDFRRAYMWVTHLVEAEPLHIELGVRADELNALLEVLARVGIPRWECNDLSIVATSALALAIQAFDRLQQVARDSGLAMILKIEWKAPEVMGQLDDPKRVDQVRSKASMSSEEARYYRRITNEMAVANSMPVLHPAFELNEQLAPVLIGTSVYELIQGGKPFVWASMSDPVLDRIWGELEPEYRALERAASVDGRSTGADEDERDHRRSATAELDPVALQMRPLKKANSSATAIARMEAYFQAGGTTTSLRGLVVQLNCSLASIRSGLKRNERVRTLRNAAKACSAFERRGVRVNEADRQRLVHVVRSHPERVDWALKSKEPAEMKQLLQDLRASPRHAR